MTAVLLHAAQCSIARVHSMHSCSKQEASVYAGGSSDSEQWTAWLHGAAMRSCKALFALQSQLQKMREAVALRWALCTIAISVAFAAVCSCIVLLATFLRYNKHIAVFSASMTFAGTFVMAMSARMARSASQYSSACAAVIKQTELNEAAQPRCIATSPCAVSMASQSRRDG